MTQMKKRTATRSEQKAITKMFKAGLPKSIVAREMNMYEDSLLNHVPKALRARIEAQERLHAKAVEEEKKKQDALDLEAQRILDKETLKELEAKEFLTDEEKEEMKELKKKVKK